MQSSHLHSAVMLVSASIHNPNSHVVEPKINHSSQHHSCNSFSEALLSLRICTENRDPKTGSCFHAQIMKLGLESDVFIGNSLLNMYAKSEQIRHAENLFDEMPHRTIVSWTSMMSAYNRNGLADETVSLFSRTLECLKPNEFTLAVGLQACGSKGDENLVEAIHCYAVKSGLILDGFLQNSLIDAYAKSGMLGASEKLLEKLFSKDVVSWTSVISGYVSHGNAERAIELFFDMQEYGVFPNDVTILTILRACAQANDFKVMQWVHGLVLKGSWCMSSLVLNSLMEMYSTNGYFTESMTIFCRFCFNNEGIYPSPETMANILQGCGNFGLLQLGEQIHGYLIKHGYLPCTVAENSLINMYAKNGYEDSALLLFRTMVERDVISWNTIISCFVKNGQPVEALRLLNEIHRERDNVSPDFVTVLASLEACADLALLPHGQAIHGYLTRTGLLSDIFVQNALIDMYAKTGNLDHSENIFNKMHERDIGSWNSIIAAYGMNGNGISALNSFADLERSIIMKPNAITFVNLLSACAHTGLVEKGLEIFNSMEMCYGISPRLEHFACVVDLLGRAGRVEEAEKFVHTMTVQPDRDIWRALLSASVLFGNLRIAEKAAKELAILEPTGSVWRVALANAYAAANEWQKVAEIRAELRGTRMPLRKERGWSSVNVEGCEVGFMAGDTKRPESGMMYEMIGALRNHMKDGFNSGIYRFGFF